MKKEPIIYATNATQKTENRKSAIGQLLHIGKPSKPYYKNIHPSLNYSEHTLNVIQDLLKLEGEKVKISSILKIWNSSEIDVLHKKYKKCSQMTLKTSLPTIIKV